METEDGLIAGRDAEVVHRARVAVRRLRSDLRSFRPLVDLEWSTPLRQELAWLGNELGAVRDLDVLIMRLRAAAAGAGGADDAKVKAVIQSVRAGRLATRKRLSAALRSDRYRLLRDRLQSAARAPRLTLASRLTASDGLVPIVRKRWKRLKAAADDLPTRPSAAVLHHVRILAKRCRYAAECVVPAVGKPAEAFAGAAAAVQDALGELNDAECACRALRRMRAEPEMALAANALLALETDAAARARLAWPDAWRALDRKVLRSWL